MRSTKIFVRAVDHDLRHGVVAEERLQRPVAEDVVGDVGDDLPALLAGERRAVESELLHDRPHDALFEVVGRLGREELGAQPRDARVVDAALQLRVRVGLLRARRRPAPRGGERWALRSAVLLGGDDDGAVDAIVETHD